MMKIKNNTNGYVRSFREEIILTSAFALSIVYVHACIIRDVLGKVYISNKIKSNHIYSFLASSVMILYSKMSSETSSIVVHINLVTRGELDVTNRLVFQLQ